MHLLISGSGPLSTSIGKIPNSRLVQQKFNCRYGISARLPRVEASIGGAWRKRHRLPGTSTVKVSRRSRSDWMTLHNTTHMCVTPPEPSR